METTTVLHPGDCKPPSGRRMKARAPPPPNLPPTACKVNNEHKSTTDLGMLPDQCVINMKENLVNRTVDFTVVLPDGEEQNNIMQGSKAVMDVLVDLCSRYHLNPAHHTLELLSWGTQQPLSYKPNTLIGALDIQKIVLKEKIPEGKTKRPPPKVPEKTTRLVVNYLKTQKAVVRVSPEVPLQNIIPAICEKCEVSEEHLVLLKDTITGEELELTKSLNELGIKELYAWDRKRVIPSKAHSEPSLNYRETRNSPTTCDTSEKEKKRFLGFFKTNKRHSKAEECLMRMDRDYGSEEPLKSTSEQSLDGVMTAPSSPSVNSRSTTLGPSLSLGNISGMTASTEIKKRRAPPPPIAIPQLQSEETNGQEKTLTQMSQSSSQNELQKKKRRAPPPPPPTPAMPNRTEEMEDKRKSTVGNGRHVPQKPPRGNTRGPPQLVIPPPPPYPPPDRDTMDSTVLYSEADVTDPTKLVPKRNLQLSHDIYSIDDDVLELSEIEETTSVNSCFASEDTTEDSGVMSSPSDVVSLDSQNDSVKSRDKIISAQDTLAEMESTFVAESCFVKNSSFIDDKSGNILQSRDDDEMMDAKFENADVFIDAHLQQTLAELDKDLAAMESMHDDSESRSISSEINDASIPLPQNEVAQNIPLAVPVTIIDEVPEADIAIHSSTEEENTLSSEAQADEDIPVDTISLEKLTNENNNAGSFSKGYMDDGSSSLSKSLLQQQSSKEELRHQTEEQKYEFELPTPPCEKINKINTALEILAKHGVDSEESKAKVIASTVKLTNEVNETEEIIKSLNHQNTKEGLPSKIKTESKFRHTSAKAPGDKQEIPSPSLWCHRVHSAVTSYEPKIGLTTFKVVPPKPGVKCFDRGASLSTGAIKIDELGNLVTPNAGGFKKVTVNMASCETEETLIGKAKAYWRSNSMEKQSEVSPVGRSNKPVVVSSSKPFSEAAETKPDCLTNLKAATSPLVASKALETHLGPEKIKPLRHVTESSLKTQTAAMSNQDKLELPFQKPQRKTSSHYVASAIAKRIAPPQLKTNLEMHDKGEENSNEKEVNPETELLLRRCIIVAKYCPVEKQPARTKEPYSSIFSCSKNSSNTLPLGAHSRMTNNSANIKPLNTTNPSNCYRRSISEPFTTTSSKDSGITEKKPSWGAIQNTIVRETSSLLNPNGKQTDQPSSTFFLGPSNAHLYSTTSKSVRGPSVSTGSLELNGAPNYTVSEKEELLSNSSARIKQEPNVRDENIYNVFGPKKKFKPVIQKPLPKDTSLHSALMEAIQTSGGRERLRKISDNTVNGTQKNPLFTEPENERSALLAAIRGHSGTSRLRKISSSASEELQGFRNAEVALQSREPSQTEHLCNLLPPPPPPPPPPTQLTMKIRRSFANSVTDNPGDAREALMEAIRSGTGAARLRKVPLLV
ncbi:protein cordon-bleu isoform X3 [Hemicordylus capensis]|uniref:protein cordon-bleu isoform X3 n=1 Tax=Hemicordylus capensis TaxID=884348 RepID=UPI0023033729|nr:protein cordon-bleu isoform X3 [Hemicordylus capensis]